MGIVPGVEEEDCLIGGPYVGIRVGEKLAGSPSKSLLILHITLYHRNNVTVVFWNSNPSN